VVATMSILGDLAKHVVGDAGTVEVLMPLGADPHAFEPSARQVARLRSADLIVANGLGLERNLDGPVDAARRDGVQVFVLGEAVHALPFPESGADDALDPHVWMDPVRVAGGVVALGEALAEVEPSRDWVARARRYEAEILAAHERIEALVAEVPADERVLVTNHEVLGYFAERYGFDVVATIIPGGTTLAEPGAAELAGLAETVRATGVAAVFGETTQPTRLAETLRAEVGDIRVVTLHTESLGKPGSSADTYLAMMLDNARLIVDGLRGRG
jgi:zinc/manganese transport system substrate-binding protein